MNKAEAAGVRALQKVTELAQEVTYLTERLAQIDYRIAELAQRLTKYKWSDYDHS